MTAMRRGRTWSFAAWVPDGPGRRQVWRGGYRTKAEAAAAERRFLVEFEDESAKIAAGGSGPTVAEFLTDWLVQSEPTRGPTTSVSYERRCLRVGSQGRLLLIPKHTGTQGWLGSDRSRDRQDIETSSHGRVQAGAECPEIPCVGLVGVALGYRSGDTSCCLRPRPRKVENAQ